MRKTKIECNRTKKCGDFSSSANSSDSNDNSDDNIFFPSYSKSDEIDVICKDLDLSDIVNGSPEFEPICNIEQNNELPEAVYRKAVEFEFSMVPIARPITDYRNTFNELEGNKLTELLNATSVMQSLAASITSQATNLLEVCQVMGLKCEQDIRDCIKMSKRLTGFNTIREDDKYVLMKHTSLGLSCLRSVIIYDTDKEYFTMTLVC